MLQGRVLPPLAGSLLALASRVGLALAAGASDAPPASCAGPLARDLPGETVELAAGPGVWSAWLSYPPAAGETITVLWRADGFVPDLRLNGADRFGHRLAVEFGPSPVLPQLRGGGLLWPRGGREWGSRVYFSPPRCWDVDVTAGGRRGELT